MHFTLVSELICRVHVVCDFAILHVAVLVLRFNVFGLRDPIKVSAKVFFNLLLLTKFLEIAAIFRLRSFFRKLTGKMNCV